MQDEILALAQAAMASLQTERPQQGTTNFRTQRAPLVAALATFGSSVVMLYVTDRMFSRVQCIVDMPNRAMFQTAS